MDQTQTARNTWRTPHLLTVALALLMAAQAGLGLLFPAQYRDADWITATWFGNDCFTLVVAVPLLVMVLVLGRDSIRGLLLWVGLLGYGVYNYAYYLFGAELNAFFPLYVLPCVLSSVILILVLARTDVERVAAGFEPHTPVRLVGGYLVFVGASLACVWLTMWAAYVFAGRATPVAPEAFKLVAALDLSMMVTALVVGGVLLWRRRAWGYVIAAIAGIQGALYLMVLSVNSLVAIDRGLAEAPGELPVWGTLAVLTTVAVALLLAHVRAGSSIGRPMPRRCGSGFMTPPFPVSPPAGRRQVTSSPAPQSRSSS